MSVENEFLRMDLNQSKNCSREIHSKYIISDINKIEKIYDECMCCGSKLAKKLRKTYFRRLNELNKELKDVSSFIPHYVDERFIDEDATIQAKHFVEGFLWFFKRNEFRIGENVACVFSIIEHTERHAFERGFTNVTKEIPNGVFSIKFHDEIIFQRMIFYSKEGIYKVASKDQIGDFSSDEIVICESYEKYVNVFKKTFVNHLKCKFKSDNFKLTFVGEDIIKLELI